MKTLSRWTAVAAAVLAVAGCSGDVSRDASPVALIVTNSQILQTLDLNGGTGCAQDVGTINLQATIKNPNQISDQTFNQVRVTRYRVSYTRTDGGKIVPATFVRNIDTLLTPGGAPSSSTKFQLFELDSLLHAPFQSLFPNNGGRDPETGRPIVALVVTVEVFGETLAGERVSGSTSFPLDFCFDCGGCS
jgi:hypothetical protein